MSVQPKRLPGRQAHECFRETQGDTMRDVTVAVGFLILLGLLVSRIKRESRAKD